MTAEHRRFDVVVVGSLNLDLVSTCERMPLPGETVIGDDFAEHPGGKGLNQAVAAARAGARVAMIGAIGDDDAGRRLRGVLDVEGIDHHAVTTVDAPTGRAAITVDRSGENSIVVVPGANALVDVADLPEASVVLGQLEVPVASLAAAFAAARTAGARTVLNPAPAHDDLGSLLADTDLVVPNEHEYALLGSTDGPSTDVPTVVRTEGARGVTVFDGDGARHLDAFEVDVVDTTGAGDAFCGAMAARLAAGDPLDVAVRFGAAAGALATTRRGAVPSIPTLSDIRRLLDRPD